MILGMHRSGTSALARVISLLGADLPQSLMGGEAGHTASNPTGHWESEPLAKLNEALLRSAGLSWRSIEPVAPDWYQSARFAEFRDSARDTVEEEFGASNLFVYKDPRTCLLVPFWLEVMHSIGIDVRVICTYRDVEEIARSLHARNEISPDVARLLWLRSVIEAEGESRQVRRVHVSYDQLLADWAKTTAHIGEGLGISWPKHSHHTRREIGAFLDDGLRHHEVEGDQFVKSGMPWLDELGEIFNGWCQTGEDPAQYGRLDLLRSSFNDGVRLFGAPVEHAIELEKQAAGGTRLRKTLRRKLESVELDHAAEIAAQRDELARQHGEQIERLKADHARALGEAEQNRIALALAHLSQTQALEAEAARLREKAVESRILLAAKTAEIDRLAAMLDRTRSDHAAAQEQSASQISELERLLHDCGQRLDEQLRQAEQGQASVAALGHRVRYLQRQVDSASWIKLLLQPLKRLTGSGKVSRERLKERAAVATSGLFDAAWYLAVYPDVALSDMDPLDHFLSVGASENRNPSDRFDVRRYVDRYPDVAIAGHNPLVHYVLNGKDEGRQHFPVEGAGTLSGGGFDETAMDAADGPVPHWEARELKWLGGGEAAPEIVPLAAMMAGDGALSVGGKLVGAIGDGCGAAGLALVDRLALFATLCPGGHAITLAGELVEPAGAADGLDRSGLGLAAAVDGWLVDDRTLVLRLADALPEGCEALRAVQVAPDGAVQLCAEIGLVPGGLNLVELRLANPLMPVLLLLGSADGAVRVAGLLPFPSLLRGGLHYGELAVNEAAPDYWSSLSDYSHALLREWIGWDEAPQGFVLGQYEIDMRGATGLEPMFRRDVVDALARLFGVRVSAHGVLEGDGARALALQIDPSVPLLDRPSQGASLLLPVDGLPSLWSLVARRLAGPTTGQTMCVADAATRRPAYAITVPVNDPSLPGLQGAVQSVQLPMLRGDGAVIAESGAASLSAPVIAMRHHVSDAWRMADMFPTAPDCDVLAERAAIPRGGVAPLVSIVVRGTPEGGIGDGLLDSLREQTIAESCELLVGIDRAADASDSQCNGELAVRHVEAGAGVPTAQLNRIASAAQGDFILFVDQDMVLHDPRTIETLVAIAQTDGTASAACVSVSERPEDRENRFRQHSTGYFPLKISFHSEPRFEFDQVDLTTPLPLATYPVAANHAKCLLVRAAVWCELGRFDAARFPVTSHDLDFGLRALRAGYRNYCTTLVVAACSEPLAGGDLPDPLARDLIRPGDLPKLLGTITLFRTLHR